MSYRILDFKVLVKGIQEFLFIGIEFRADRFRIHFAVLDVSDELRHLLRFITRAQA